MKAIFTLIVIGMLASCTVTGKHSPAPVADNSPTQHATDEGLSSMFYEQMLPQFVARLSKRAGIPDLKSMSLSETQTELRLWKGFGVAYPRCFVLKIDNGNAAASFASVKVVGNKVVYRKGNAVFVNTPLNAPHSGWASFLAYLKENGIDTSINLALDKRYEPDPDEEALILEMKTSSRYTMAPYLDSTVTVDGKKAFAICDKVENEFDIQLGCKL